MALAKQDDAFTQMVDLKHKIIAGQHPFSWDKHGFQYVTFASVEDFERHVELHKDEMWINEIVPSSEEPWRDMLGALGAPLPPPRLCFDIDYELPGKGDHEQYAEIIRHVKDLAQVIVRRYLRDLEFALEFIEMDGSREKSARKYKHSSHIVVANVALENWASGRQIVADMDKEWEAGNPPDHLKTLPIDRSIYSKNRNMRVQGSKKEKGQPPLRSPFPFRETLITHYEKENVRVIPNVNFAQKNLKRKREYSISKASGVKNYGENNVFVESLQEWLDTKPLPKSLMWTGAKILQAYSYDTCHYIWFKVGFREKGVKHLCVGGHMHNGNASQSWKIRLDKRNFELHAACWPNSKWELNCQSGNGELKYLPIKGLGGKAAKLI